LIFVNIPRLRECSIGAMQQVYLMNRTGSEADRSRAPRFIEGVLASLELFRDIAPRSIVEVAAHSRTQQLRRGDAILSRGDRLPGVLVMAYGTAKLGLRRGDGEERVLRFLGANEAFGAASVLLDRPCPLDIVALADSMLVLVPARPLLRLAEFDPKFAGNLMKHLAGSLLGLITEFEDSVQRSAVQRLASYLGLLAKPAQGLPNGTVRLPASKTLIAARLGITKETMSRLLRDLANRGLISVSGREIRILDGTRLALVAS
jgi:CRP-like cAMP-binding protein